MTRVSAIVVTYHTGPRLKECLYALSADPEISETIIVDNGNPEEMTAWLRTFCEAREQTELLTGHGNIGFIDALYERQSDIKTISTHHESVCGHIRFTREGFAISSDRPNGYML